MIKAFYYIKESLLLKLKMVTFSLSYVFTELTQQGFFHYDKVVCMAESGQAKKHVFCSDGTVAGKGCKTLACASEVLVE